MMHALIAPNLGHPVVHHFGDGASVWGSAITPTVSHVVQNKGAVALEYTGIRPGIVFDAVSLPLSSLHVEDTSTIRLEADMAALRRAGLTEKLPLAALICIETENGCLLKMWGDLIAESSLASDRKSVASKDSTALALVPFKVTFWEISGFTRDASTVELRRLVAEKDRRIRELEAKVALANCSQ